jgi:transposase
MISQTTTMPKVFISMDVHKKSWTCHFKTDLFDYKSGTIPANSNVLKEYVQKHFPDREVACCYEAGCCGYWIAGICNSLGSAISCFIKSSVPVSTVPLCNITFVLWGWKNTAKPLRLHNQGEK